MPTGPLQIVMLVIGITLAFVGLFIARAGRGLRSHALSAPTRVVIGLTFAVTGYHLIVWAFPQSLTPLQLNRQFWWVLLAAAFIAPLLSFVMDRWLASRPPENSEPPQRDDDELIR